MTPNIFISYSHRDEEFVNSLVNQLRRLNFNCWMDVYGRIQPGEIISDNITNAIRSCDFLICYLTENAINSDWIRQEVSLAFKDKGPKSIIFLCNSEQLRNHFPECLIAQAYPNFHDVRIPIITSDNFYKACLELISRIWQSYQDVRFPRIEIENLLEKSSVSGIAHIKYGEFTEQEDENLRNLIKTSKRIKFLGFNGGAFVRTFSEELKFFFEQEATKAMFLLATPQSEFYNENTFLVSKAFYKDNRDTHEISNTIARLESYANEKLDVEKIQVRHFNTQLRNPLIIFDDKICHLTLCIPPIESFKSITFELQRISNKSLVDKCVMHFDSIWKVARKNEVDVST